MKSSSEPKEWTLADRILVHVAGRLGPGLDQIEPNVGKVTVVDLVRELACDEGGPSPTAVRAALLDLCDRRLLYRRWQPQEDVDLLEGWTQVGLRVRGLMAARELEPDCGRVVKRVTLRFRDKSEYLDARFETGNKERDDRLNQSGMVLAAFYVVAATEPTRERPLMVEHCESMFANLAAHGVGPRRGPGERLEPKEDAVRTALGSVKEMLPLKQDLLAEDRRRDFFYLDGPMPEVRVAAASRRQFKEWKSLKHAVWSIAMNQFFQKPDGTGVQPLTREDKAAADAAAAPAG